MDKTRMLQKLLNGTATKKEIELLRQMLARGEISIGGNVSNSVIIQGSENNVQFFQLTSEKLELLGGSKFLGNLERDLTGDEIAFGLGRLEDELSLRAPVLTTRFQEQARRLRPSLKTNPNALSEFARKERLEALAHINSLCMEALDIAFNAVALGDVLPEYEARCPFRGLESFRVEDREFFFGREELTKKLVGKIKAHSFLAVLGASGSGKSSLVMAGMIPALHLDYAVIRPGTNPLGALESARGKSLLVVDQFEELFTLTRNEQTRADFISALLDSTKSGRVIITLRSDFLGEAGAYRSLSGEIQNHLEIIPPMNADELFRAMEGQAHWAQLEFEADLSQQILDDVAGEPGAMPLLQHALWELWNRRHGRHLRANEYRAFGGVKQAITSTAEKVYGEGSKLEQEQVRDIFLRLTRLDKGDEGRDTRRRVLLDDLIPSRADAASISALLDKLAGARLIVKTVNDDVTEIEVAHEALIRHWERLRAWLNEDRDNLRLREDVSDNARQWNNVGRDESLLNHRGARLELALAMSRKPQYPLNPVERAYLEGCVGLREREITSIKRRRGITLTSGIAVFGILAVILTGWIISGNNAAQQQRSYRASELFRISETVSEYPQKRLLLLIEALNTIRESDPPIPDLETNLRKYLGDFSLPPLATDQDKRWVATSDNPDGFESANGRWHVKLTDDAIELSDTNNPSVSPISLNIGKSQSRYPLAISNDGQWLAIGDNLQVNLWNTKSLSRISLLEHENSVTAIAFSPDDRWLVTGTYYGVVRRWDLENLAPLTPEQLTYKESDPMGPPTFTLAFSPDGRWLAAGGDGAGTNMAGADDRIQIWDMNVSNPERIFLNSVEGVVNGIYISFSPNGRWLANGGSSSRVSVWDLKDAFSHVLTLRGYENGIAGLKFSPDGNRLAIVADGNVRILDMMNTNDLLMEPVRFPQYKSSDEFSYKPDYYQVVNQRWFVTKNQNQPLMVWNIENPAAPPVILSGGSDFEVGSLVISPDSRWLALGDGNSELKLWDLQTPNVQPQILSGDASIESLAFYQEGNKLFALLSGSDQLRALAWDMQKTPPAPLELRQFDAAEHIQAISLTGRWIVTVRDNGVASLWDMWDPASEPKALPDYGTEALESMSFSPDEYWLAKGGLSGSVKVWDLQQLGVAPSMTYQQEIVDFIRELEFSPDNHWLAVCIGSSLGFNLQLLDLQNMSARKILAEDVTNIVFSSKSHWLAAGNRNGSVQVWNLRNIAAAPFELYGNGNPIAQLAFDPNENWLVSTTYSSYSNYGDSGTAFWWDMQNPHLYPVVLNGYPPLSFSKDGHWLLAGVDYATSRLWRVDLDDEKELACEVVNRNLTRAEWAQYFPDEDYRATCPQWPIEPEPTATPMP